MSHAAVGNQSPQQQSQHKQIQALATDTVPTVTSPGAMLPIHCFMQRAETQGQTVRQMLNKTKRLESTCPLDDQTSTDLMTIDPDREPEFNQQDDSDTNNTDLEANTPVEANKTAGANITIRAEIHHKSNDTDHHDHIIYEATPIQDLDAAKPTDEISTVPTEEKSTVPTDEISTVPTDEISTVPTDEISTVPTEEKSTFPTDEIPADEAWEKKLIHYCQHF
ncbi:uncharacterized protein LOC143053484 isoform X1 [Mytilus galloprovincialis]|uniref:uncharacterized protein LOC143053484 isoform X1 n=1 Tax=Mytilus galloprovincialis TaxID=29158 RepID=UPI003F7C577F